MSNFLGDIGSVSTLSSILSAAELMTREGVDLRKGMNYRDDGLLLSVFLVLPTHDGEYRDRWNAETGIYEFEGHDSTTIDAGGKAPDQLMMYESGRVTDNGKFYKAAHAFKDGIRAEPLQIQIYEKLDAGVWYDKGIFNLVDARRVSEGGRMVFKFDVQPVGRAAEAIETERMLPITEKIAAWVRDKGRCAYCTEQSGLRFVPAYGKLRVICATHRGEQASRGLLG